MKKLKNIWLKMKNHLKNKRNICKRGLNSFIAFGVISYNILY